MKQLFLITLSLSFIACASSRGNNASENNENDDLVTYGTLIIETTNQSCTVTYDIEVTDVDQTFDFSISENQQRSMVVRTGQVTIQGTKDVFCSGIGMNTYAISTQNLIITELGATAQVD